MGSSSKVVRPEEVLESLKNDGSIDALRMKIIAQLKANVRAGFPSAPDSPPIPSMRPFILVPPVTIMLSFLLYDKRKTLYSSSKTIYS
jgi:hypothetical protein